MIYVLAGMLIGITFALLLIALGINASLLLVTAALVIITTALFLLYKEMKENEKDL